MNKLNNSTKHLKTHLLYAENQIIKSHIMKKSSKFLIGVVIVLSFILGYFLGLTIDYPKTDNSKMAGTIGRMNNYRNVKVTENDVKLRSELQSNPALLKGYQQYFAFHYSNSAKLYDDIGFAIQTSESITDFKETYSSEIEKISVYKMNLEQARLDILLALTALQKLSDADDNNIGLLINNANIAIAQSKYKQEDLTSFIEAIETFLNSNASGDFADLKKVHDLLAMNEIILAAATNDKPMLKYLDKKELFSSSEKLAALDKEKLNENIKSDFGKLNVIFSENKELGIILNTETIGNVESQLNGIIFSIEKLGVIIWNSDKLGVIDSNEKLGAISKDEKLGCIFNAEKLGRLLNAEKLGFFSNEKLGVLNFEKLSIFDKEGLNIII